MSRDPGAAEMALATIRPALAQHGGNLTHTAATLGVPLRTFMRWVAETPCLRAAIAQARGSANAAGLCNS